jgi:predicted HD superfamily hydrolase involved in NAD metabolism
MLSREEIIENLRTNLTPERFLHSLNVAQTAAGLANHFGADIKRAEVAGLVHDCVKDLPASVQLKMAENFGILLDDIEKLEPALIHGPLGAVYAREAYGIQEEDILRAVRMHTTGDVNMTLLDKIIFISDYIEPARSFPGVEELRKKACIDLDEAVLLAFDSTIKYVLARKSLLHPRTVNARNFLLMQKGREEKP